MLWKISQDIPFQSWCPLDVWRCSNPFLVVIFCNEYQIDVYYIVIVPRSSLLASFTIVLLILSACRFRLWTIQAKTSFVRLWNRISRALCTCKESSLRMMKLGLWCLEVLMCPPLKLYLRSLQPHCLPLYVIHLSWACFCSIYHSILLPPAWPLEEGGWCQCICF